MKLVHICSDYSGTHLYRSLISQLGNIILNQIVYVPVRSRELVGMYDITNGQNIKIVYSFILRKWHRLFFFRKINDEFKDFNGKIDIQNYDLIHAHFLFSDGALALKCKKKFGTKYVVTVRNTDINIFFKYLLHLRKTGFEILSHAESVIVLNPRYKEKLLSYLPYSLQQKVQLKMFVVPNGIENFWLENKFSRQSITDNQQLNLLYVGEFSKNKNLETSVKVADSLIDKGINLSFKMVGNYGDNCIAIRKLADKRPYIQIIDKVTDKKKLMQYYREADIFLMVSFYESFGLVYLEAMSQGCPVIYSAGQGIDGYFKNGIIGYSVHPKNTEEIVNAVLKIRENFNLLSANCIENIDSFSWQSVADSLQRIYKPVLTAG
ncbi:MAG: glycosyltransferase family 4 protein [Bacteroidales bacterium]